MQPTAGQRWFEPLCRSDAARDRGPRSVLARRLCSGRPPAFDEMSAVHFPARRAVRPGRGDLFAQQNDFLGEGRNKTATLIRDDLLDIGVMLLPLGFVNLGAGGSYELIELIELDMRVI